MYIPEPLNPDDQEQDHDSWKNPWLMVAVFCVLAIGACVVGAIIFNYLIKPHILHA